MYTIFPDNKNREMYTIFPDGGSIYLAFRKDIYIYIYTFAKRQISRSLKCLLHRVVDNTILIRDYVGRLKQRVTAKERSLATFATP